jgi:hypothetical protein
VEINNKNHGKINEIECKRTLQRVNGCFFENMNEIDQPLAKLTKRKRGKDTN